MSTSVGVLLDDRDMPGELRHDLDAFLSAQPEVERLGAFIPHLEAASTGIIAVAVGTLTTVYAVIQKPLKDSAGEIVQKLVMKWAMKRFNLIESEAKESVILVDQFSRPCVKVELDSIPKSKR